jgi:lipid-binding SYLF domain-containing protein
LKAIYKKEDRKMKEKKERWTNVKIVLVFVVLTVGVLFLYSASIIEANDMETAQGVVDRAQITFKELIRDPNYAWLHNSLDHAKGVLIFPQIIKGGFIWGGSGGTGVLLVRDDKTGDWSQPAFYTIGSVTFGLQIGGEAAQVVMLAMTQRAIDSLLSSSFKLGGDVSVAVGPVGVGAKANADILDITADFISFTKSKGLYGGINLEGSVVAVRDSLNEVYYGRYVRPVDILVRNRVVNARSAEIRETLKCKC